MSDQLPTRQEILEKYRGVIDNEDFEILAAESFPLPESIRQEDASLQYLGTLKGAYVWAKRQLGRVIAVIVFFGGFMQGIEYTSEYSRIAYDQIVSVVQLAQRHLQVPATEYRIFERQDNWTLPPDPPFALADYLGPSTTTTTPAPTGSSNLDSLPPGSGLIPYSGRWGQFV